MKKFDGFKLVSIASAVLTVTSTLLSSVVSKKSMNQTIKDEVEKALSKTIEK